MLCTELFSRVSAARLFSISYRASIAFLRISPLQIHKVSIVLTLGLILHRILSRSAHLGIVGQILIINVSPVAVVSTFNIVCSCLSLHSTILVGFGRGIPLPGFVFTLTRRGADEIADCASCHVPNAGEWGGGSVLTKLHL